MEDEKKYEEYLEKVRECTKIGGEQSEAMRKQLYEEYKDVIEAHEAHEKELDRIFDEEQRKIGLSFEGKYYRLTRNIEENGGMNVITYFKLDEFGSYIGERNQPFVLFLMKGVEVMTLLLKDGSLVQLNSRMTKEGLENCYIQFANVTDEYNTTEEISKEQFERDVAAMKDVYYNDILK